MAARFSGPGQPYEGLAVMKSHGPQWTGKVQLVEKHLEDPLRWKKPRRIFVNSMSDLFHEAIPNNWIDEIFTVMALCRQHTFQVLTKRPERMLKYLSDKTTQNAIVSTMIRRSIEGRDGGYEDDPYPVWPWPLPNVWLGVSIEDQKAANERIPLLLNTPAAVRWLSCEPLLGPVNLNIKFGCAYSALGCACSSNPCAIHPTIDWVVAGGESGPNARPMHPDWVRSLRDQCWGHNVSFLFKQWGEYAPISPETAMPLSKLDSFVSVRNDGVLVDYIGSDATGMWRAGKKVAGRSLDGREWNEYPREVQQ